MHFTTVDVKKLWPFIQKKPFFNIDFFSSFQNIKTFKMPRLFD